MTYNPPPRQPPQSPLGYQPRQPFYSDGLAPARRAAVLCWVLGGLGLCCGLCLNLIAFLAPMDKIAAEGRTMLSPEQLQAMGNVDLPTVLKVLYAALGIAAVVISILLLILGGFVRRGGRGGIITAMVVFVCVALVSALGVLSGLVQAATGLPQGMIGSLVWLVIGSIAGLAIVWLLQALRAPKTIGVNPPQAYYQQLQQYPALQPPPGYGYGYGYGAPPPSPQQSLGPMPPPPDQTGESRSGDPRV